MPSNIKPFWNDQKKRWMVNVPKKLQSPETKKQPTFKSREQANLFVKNILSDAFNHGNSAIRFLGLEALRLQKVIDLAGNLEQLEAIVREWQKTNPSREQKTVKEAIEEFHASKEFEGTKMLQRRTLKKRLGYFLRSYPDRQLSSLASGEIQSWLQKLQGEDKKKKPRPLSNTTKKNIHRSINQFWNWCERREYVTRNPMNAVASPKQDEPKKEIFTIEQLEAMIKESTDEERILIALGAFAGLRASEIEGNEDHPGIRWENLDFEKGEIWIPKEVTKKTRERIVPMFEPFKALITNRKKSGPMFKVYDQKKRAMRQSLAKKAGLKSWPNNALRHSFASYHLAAFEDVSKTSLMIGHRDPETTFKHYARLVRKADGEKFFKISPK